MELFADNIRMPFAGSVNLKLFNPMFNDTGGHSLPVSFNGKIPAVRKAFGFAGAPGIDNPESVDARISTRLLNMAGKWVIGESSGDKIEAYFKANTGDFYSLIARKMLNALDFGGIKYPAGVGASQHDVAAVMTNMMEATYLTNDWTVFMAYLPNAYGTDTVADLQLVNDIEFTIVTNQPSIKEKGTLAQDTVYLFAGTVIDYLFEEFGYRIGRNIFRENAGLQKLVIFNTYNRKTDAVFDYGKLVPQISCTDFLKAITNRFNIGFFINEKSKLVDILSFDDIILKAPVSVNTRFTSKPVINNRRMTGMAFPLNAPDDWSTHTFTGSGDFYPAAAEVVNKFRDIVPGAGTNFHNYYVKSENAYYRVIYKDSTYQVERICAGNFPYNAGEGGTEITQYSGIAGMYTFTRDTEYFVIEGSPPGPVGYNTDVDFVMPRCDLECTDVLTPNRTFPLIFLFARGLGDSYVVPTANSPSTFHYPLGNNNIYDAKGAVISGVDNTLNWGETGGIIEAFWTNRINWELNIKKVVKGSLTCDDIDKLIDFGEIHRIENNNYIVNSLGIDINRDTVRVTEAELFRV